MSFIKQILKGMKEVDEALVAVSLSLMVSIPMEQRIPLLRVLFEAAGQMAQMTPVRARPFLEVLAIAADLGYYRVKEAQRWGGDAEMALRELKTDLRALYQAK